MDVGELSTRGAGTCFALSIAVLGAEMTGFALFGFEGLLPGDWLGELYARPIVWDVGDGEPCESSD